MVRSRSTYRTRSPPKVLRGTGYPPRAAISSSCFGRTYRAPQYRLENGFRPPSFKRSNFHYSTPWNATNCSAVSGRRPIRSVYFTPTERIMNSQSFHALLSQPGECLEVQRPPSLSVSKRQRPVDEAVKLNGEHFSAALRCIQCGTISAAPNLGSDALVPPPLFHHAPARPI